MPAFITCLSDHFTYRDYVQGYIPDKYKSWFTDIGTGLVCRYIDNERKRDAIIARSILLHSQMDVYNLDTEEKRAREKEIEEELDQMERDAFDDDPYFTL